MSSSDGVVSGDGGLVSAGVAYAYGQRLTCVHVLVGHG